MENGEMRIENVERLSSVSEGIDFQLYNTLSV